MKRFWNHNRTPTTRTATQQAVRRVCEPLETRLMYITYQVDGTSAADSISISISGNSIISVVNGVSDSGSDIINNTIEINGLGGNDTISITETGSNTVIVNGGNGDDTINVGNGANNLDVVDGQVSINGDAGEDHAIFHDGANASGATYNCLLGNQLNRVGMVQATINTENARVIPGAGDDALVFADAPFSDWIFNGNGGNNTVVVAGAAGESILYRTGGQSGGSGSVDFPSPAHTVEFFSCPVLRVNNMPSVTMRTSFDDDAFTVDATGTLTTVGGISGVGVVSPPATLVMDNVTTCTLDLGTNDGVQDDDVLTFDGASPDNTLFRVDLGGGTNVINVNADTNLNTRVGFAGGQFNAVTVNNAHAQFDGLQTPQSLILKNAGSAGFDGTGVVLSTPSLTVPAGSGEARLAIAAGQTGAVVTTFGISAGRSMAKTGGGTFNVSATQSHGSSLFTNRGGTTNFNTDCGSTSSRPLDLFSDQGTINLNATQHVDSLSTNFGDINVGANGSRVVVTNSVGVGGEGGAIDLNDNDMIVDYTGASQLAAVRQLIVNGFAGGGWNGIGIGSGSAATAAATANKTGLGYVEATQIFNTFPNTFAGQSIDATSVLVRYTLLGDGDLNGTVNIDDFGRLASNFNTPVQWFNGDFDYDGSVNIDDFGLMAANFNKVMAGSAARAGVASPHPTRGVFADNRIDVEELLSN